jgi:hypothetical protein
MSTTSVSPEVTQPTRPPTQEAPPGDGLYAARWLVLAIVLCA